MSLLGLFIISLLLSLICVASAFHTQLPSTCHVVRKSSCSWHVINKQTIEPLSFRRTLSLQNQRNNKNLDEKRVGGYTNKVEDGSPLGVAIVVLGGSLIVIGGDNFADIPVWVVFVTASTAAGVARLIRYLRDK